MRSKRFPYRAAGTSKGTTYGAYSYAQKSAAIFNTDIGNFCSIGHCAVIGPFEHPLDNLSTHPFTFGGTKMFMNDDFYPSIKGYEPTGRERVRTLIGSDVWIGANAVVLRGARIGHGAVVAAGAVVKGDVPPYAIVGGVPAKIIRYRFAPEVIERLLSSAWWEFALERSKFGDISYSDISGTLDRIEFLKANGQLRKLKDVKIAKRQPVKPAPSRPTFSKILSRWFKAIAGLPARGSRKA